MPKAVMLSIRPRYCELIAGNFKSIEVRKNRPKLEPPFKCYIYCTKPSKAYQTICGCMVLNSDELYRHPREGIKYGDSIELMAEDDYTKDNFLNGKVIGEFTCDSIFPISFYASDVSFFDTEPPIPVPGTCLTDKEIAEYLGNGKTGYGWQISDLVIYDKPKQLSEFYRWYDGITDIRPCENGKPCDHLVFDYSEDHEACGIDYDGENCPFLKVSRPPQSWCYVEELV